MGSLLPSRQHQHFLPSHFGYNQTGRRQYRVTCRMQSDWTGTEILSTHHVVNRDTRKQWRQRLTARGVLDNTASNLLQGRCYPRMGR